MRPDKRSRRPGQSAVAALVLSLSRRCLLSMAVLFLILTLALKQILVDEQGFAYVLIQCIFKSYASLDTYSREPSGPGRAEYANVTQALNPTGGARHGFLSEKFPTDKDTRHNYTLNYNWIMGPYQKTATNVLEVGVKKGGSVKLWREFFNQDAVVYGIDVDPGVPTFVKDAHIKILIMDSTNGNELSRALRAISFDVIVDDGRHTPWAIGATYDALFPLLKTDGVYIVEDWPRGEQPEAKYWKNNAVLVLADSSVDSKIPEEMLVIAPLTSKVFAETVKRGGRTAAR